MDDKMTKEPEIRFTGFSDDWEQRKLGEIGTVQTCKRIFKEQTFENGEIPFYKNGTLGLKPDSYISREKYEEFKRLYPYPEVGDILISVVGSIGRTAEYTGKDEYFQDSNVVWLRTDGHINKKFLKISYQVINWLIEGSTIKHLYNDNILLSKIKCPKSRIEQQKIGEYFQNIDNLITLYQRELELLYQNKKAMLQKMFPKEGSNIPEIRFTGFNDAWEQRKFGDMLNEFSVKSKKEDEYIVLSSTNNGMEIRDGRVSGTSNRGYKIIENGDLVLSPQNLWLGNININDIGIGLVSPSYKTFKFVDVNPAFVGTQLRTTKMLEEYKNASTQGASVVRRNLELDSFYQIPMRVPSEDEQAKIGEFFTNLDNLITLHQRELDLFINFKKSMLQKMFI